MSYYTNSLKRWLPTHLKPAFEAALPVLEEKLGTKAPQSFEEHFAGVDPSLYPYLYLIDINYYTEWNRIPQFLDELFKRFQGELVYAVASATLNGEGWSFESWLTEKVEKGEVSQENRVGEVAVYLLGSTGNQHAPANGRKMLKVFGDGLKEPITQGALKDPRETARTQLRKIMEARGWKSETVAPSHSDHPDAENLLKLLEIWRETHDPDTAALIEQLDGNFPGPPKLERAGEIQNWWLNTASTKDPLNLHALFKMPWTGKWAEAYERVSKLHLFPTDPRIAKGILTFFQSCHYESFAARKLWLSALELYRRQGDPRLLPEVELLSAELGRKAWGYGGATQGAAFLERIKKEHNSTALSWEQRAVVEQVRAGLSSVPDRKTAAEFLEAIYTDPSDHALKRVLADLLTESNDPRGAFIQLQCDRAEREARGEPPNPKADREELRLLNANRTAWLVHPVGVEPDSAEFRYGFLGAAKARRAGSWKATFADPAWATVEELTLEWAYGEDVLGVLAQVHMPVLKAIYGLYDLPKEPETTILVRLQALGLLGRIPEDYPFERLPKLTTLLVTSYPRDIIAQLAQLPLQALGFTYGSDYLQEAVELAAKHQLQAKSIFFSGRAWKVTLCGEQPGIFTTLKLHYKKGAHAYYRSYELAPLLKITFPIQQLKVTAETRIPDDAKGHLETILKVFPDAAVERV
jgi:uncharacterized protein (TIGR02996 family)